MTRFAIARSDGVLVCSPEYVRGIPGGLKNAIDWLVSGDQIVGRPIALVHASHRGEDMLQALRAVLSTVSAAQFTLFLRTGAGPGTGGDLRGASVGSASRRSGCVPGRVCCLLQVHCVAEAAEHGLGKASRAWLDSAESKAGHAPAHKGSQPSAGFNVGAVQCRFGEHVAVHGAVGVGGEACRQPQRCHVQREHAEK